VKAQAFSTGINCAKKKAFRIRPESRLSSHVRARYFAAFFVAGMCLVLSWSFYRTRSGLPQGKEYGFYRSVIRWLLFIFLLYLMYDIGVEGRLSRSVELHGGAIRAKSKMGKGSAFRFILPLDRH
jgi:hypothetical protein